MLHSPGNGLGDIYSIGLDALGISAALASGSNQLRATVLKDYLRSAIRNLRRRGGYAAINVAGLAIGMACCILILLYVQDELSYDKFHEHAESIYRLRVERYASGGEAELSAQASAPMAPAALKDVPDVEDFVRLAGRTYFVRRGDRKFYEDRFFWADSAFFQVFSFDLTRGDPETVLEGPFSVVLTEETARKYFGDEDPIGKVLTIEDWDLTVTGITEGAPSHSHFHFDILGSFTTLEAIRGGPSTDWNWWELDFPTYLMLNASVQISRVQERLHEMPSRYIGDQEAGSGYRQFLYLQPITDIHLHSHYDDELEANSHVAYVYVFSAIAMFILLIACVNFMNLATARAARRAKEVSLRKVVGARRYQLIGQFLGEAVLLALLALAVALIIIQIVLPAFNDLTYKETTLDYGSQWRFVGASILFAIGVGLAAGGYPAVVLSGFRPIDVFKGAMSTGRGALLFRKGLVVFQFTISVALIVGALVVHQQLRYMQTTNLGFDEDQILVLNARNNEDVTGSYEAFKDELEKLPEVQATALSSAVPGRNLGMRVASRSRGFTTDGQTMPVMGVDHDFAETYGLELAAGRDFSREYATDDTASFLINEAATRALGWSDPSQAVGEELTLQYEDTRTIIGVVKNFHIQSLQHAIAPTVFLVHPSWFSYASVRLNTADPHSALSSIERVWSRFSSDRPMEAFFLDDDYDRQYRAEERIGVLVSLFTGLAIFIACLGLFALATFAAQRRTKEIGVRKVLGATSAGIVLLLSREFTSLVVLATAIAAPAAYLIMNQWLEEFAYRIEIGWMTFVVAGTAALLVALLTISYQSLRAARTNPTEALRYE